MSSYINVDQSISSSTALNFSLQMSDILKCPCCRGSCPNCQSLGLIWQGNIKPFNGRTKEGLAWHRKDKHQCTYKVDDPVIIKHSTSDPTTSSDQPTEQSDRDQDSFVISLIQRNAQLELEIKVL